MIEGKELNEERPELCFKIIKIVKITRSRHPLSLTISARLNIRCFLRDSTFLQRLVFLLQGVLLECLFK